MSRATRTRRSAICWDAARVFQSRNWREVMRSCSNGRRNARMNHRELTELLAYRDGDDELLSRERRAELAADPDVPAKLARLAELTQKLRDLPEQPPDEKAWAAVHARLNGRTQPGRSARYRRYWPAMA